MTSAWGDRSAGDGRRGKSGTVTVAAVSRNGVALRGGGGGGLRNGDVTDGEAAKALRATSHETAVPKIIFPCRASSTLESRQGGNNYELRNSKFPAPSRTTRHHSRAPTLHSCTLRLHNKVWSERTEHQDTVDACAHTYADLCFPPAARHKGRATRCQFR